MRLLIRSCADCPMKRVDLDGNVWCKTGKDMKIYGKGENDPDYITDISVHPDCPMLGGKVTLNLEVFTKNSVTGNVNAWIGCRIETAAGVKGIVVGKYKSMSQIPLSAEAVAALNDVEKNGTWYAFLPDGGGLKFLPESRIKLLVRTTPVYNFNDLFEFYFGFGEEPDESASDNQHN